MNSTSKLNARIRFLQRRLKKLPGKWPRNFPLEIGLLDPMRSRFARVERPLLLRPVRQAPRGLISVGARSGSRAGSCGQRSASPSLEGGELGDRLAAKPSQLLGGPPQGHDRADRNVPGNTEQILQLRFLSNS